MRQGINAGSKTICRLDDWLGVFYLKLIMPVEISILSAFLIAAAAIVLSPGPDTIVIIRYTMSSGKRIGMATMAGVQLGLVFHTILAIFGITVIIASSETLFKGVAIAGAIYLAWLGIQGFLPGSSTFSFGNGASGTPNVSAHKAWRDAFMSNALNPKVIVLYLALMPNFVRTTYRACNKRKTGFLIHPEVIGVRQDFRSIDTQLLPARQFLFSFDDISNCCFYSLQILGAILTLNRLHQIYQHSLGTGVALSGLNGQLAHHNLHDRYRCRPCLFINPDQSICF